MTTVSLELLRIVSPNDGDGHAAMMPNPMSLQSSATVPPPATMPFPPQETMSAQLEMRTGQTIALERQPSESSALKRDNAQTNPSTASVKRENQKDGDDDDFVVIVGERKLPGHSTFTQQGNASMLESPPVASPVKHEGGSQPSEQRATTSTPSAGATSTVIHVPNEGERERKRRRLQLQLRKIRIQEELMDLED